MRWRGSRFGRACGPTRSEIAYIAGVTPAPAIPSKKELELVGTFEK